MRDPAIIKALIEETIDHYDRIDVLVNNAGVQTNTMTMEGTMDDWVVVLEIDTRLFWLCVKHAFEYMLEGGSILNMSSNQAFLTMPPIFLQRSCSCSVE
jgi:NAD(P)-dependent dehydrogenase (short-subunit alcohol dehydrogenase family)